MLQLAKEIVAGRRLTAEDDLTRLITADLSELCQGADYIRKELCGNRADLCSIINGRGGRCSENCKFCAQSAHHSTHCDEYAFLATDEFVADYFLIPVKGTPLGDRKRLSTEEITRITAVFRYINPTAYIRIAAGRSYFEDVGEILFRSGANATLTGDMLTTVGNNTAEDRAMLSLLGYRLKNLRDKGDIEK